MKFKIVAGFLRDGFSLGVSGGRYKYFIGESYQFQICLILWRVTFALDFDHE